MISILTLTAASLAFFAESRYIWSVIKRYTKPSFSGWLIFTVSMSCVLFSAYFLGARESLLPIAAFTFMHLITTILSLKYGFVRFTVADVTFLSLSAIGVFLWWYTSSPWYALILNVLIDMFGYMAITAKLYLHPGTEDKIAWFMGFVAYSLNLLNISNWVPQEYLFSASNVIWCAIILIISFRKSNSQAKLA